MSLSNVTHHGLRSQIGALETCAQISYGKDHLWQSSSNLEKMDIRNLFWKDVVVWPGRLVKLWRVTISVPVCSLPCLISDDYLTNRFLSRFGEWWLWVVSLPRKVWGCSRQTFSRPSNCWPLNWVFGFLHFVCASCQLVTTLDVFFGSTLVVFIFV